jgi:Tfp pilus assembly protein PilV
MFSATFRSAKRSPKRRRQAGFQLVEAVVTAALMGIGLLGLSASSVLVTRASKSADSTGAATSLATKRLELLRSMPLDAPGHIPGNYSGGAFYPNGNPGGVINVNWVVSARDVPTWGLKTITVTATWTDPSGTHAAPVAGIVRCSTVPCRVY